MQADLDKLKQRVESMKLRYKENPSGVMGIAPSFEVFIAGGGGYGIGKFEVYKTEAGIITANRLLDGLEAQAKARRCVEKLKRQVKKIGPYNFSRRDRWTNDAFELAIGYICREFGIEEVS